MADALGVLDTLAGLERCYDGPIPEPARASVLFGSVERRLLAEAEGQARFFAALIRDQRIAIGRARCAGPIPEHLLADLKLYRGLECWWRDQAKRRQAAVTRSAGGDP